MELQKISLTRFDKNIANNLPDFGIYEKDANLVTRLAVFFSHDFQYNICNHTIFGKRILEVHDVAKALGYTNTKSLTNPHPDPAQLKEPKFTRLSKEEIKRIKNEARNGEGEPLFDTYLDNALYLCRYVSLRLSKAGKTFDGTQSSELKEIRFLKSLKKFYHPVKKRIYYEIEYDQTMINDLARFYLKFDFDIYRQLNSPSFQNLYISLINLRDRKNIENQQRVRVIMGFDALCALANTNCVEPKERKRFINSAIKAINIHHGSEFVTITWIKNGHGRFNYTAQLDFTLTDKEIIFGTVDARQKFDHFLLHNLKEAFQQNHADTVRDEDEYKKLFVRFLKEVDWLFEIKHAQVIKTWLQCVGQPVADPWSPKILSYIKEELPKMAEKPLWPGSKQRAIG